MFWVYSISSAAINITVQTRQRHCGTLSGRGWDWMDGSPGVRYRCRVAPWEGSRWMDLRVVKSTYGANNQNHISFGLQNKGHLSFSQVCFAYVVWDRLSKDCAANNGGRMMNELGEWLLASTPLLAKTPPAFNIHFFRCNSIS